MENKKYVFVGHRDDEVNDQMEHEFVKTLIEKGVKDQIKLVKTEIFGLHTYDSILKVMPDDVVYTNLDMAGMNRVIDEHLIGGEPVKDLLYKGKKEEYIDLGDEPFYHKQYRIVLKNAGVIDPESIEEYLGRNGYKGLVKAISEMNPESVIEEMKKSGLRGRGGGGFPTWMKWNFSRQVENKTKYIVCNADEGDPGAYMDRSVLESDPHALVEGMAIAGFAVGATKGFIYCRAEYPLAIKRLELAIKEAGEYGLLGKNILGTGVDFELEVRLGAGAFVCGEETALLASIEGKRGMPKPRPPFPAVKGLWDKPTVINNVETLSNVPVIMYKGGDWYGAIGTEKSKGTKVFALCGKVLKSGLVEVPMGTTLEEIIFDVGGGSYSDIPFKAAQTGGPSGGVIPPQFLKTPISYESLLELGSIMGSGGLIVMDEADCMVDVSKFYLQFTVDESCGKCAPCRIGGKQLLGLLEKVTNGTADESTIKNIHKVSNAMKKASLCGLGQTSPNPVLSTLKYYENEYLEHINDKKCSTGVCKDLVQYTVVEDKCIGCTLCARKCPVSCIDGKTKEPHFINQDKCIKCGECFTACKFDAINVG